ncbi:GNAT family N-acetyltransferase [Brachybacterium huguangmaarense]|uniref:GNAT family N-acetyltransferase n=1 Tax=Brachybacterium huguangmaarense TaxID=1652028 RepID=A0ABY6G1X4_9MICO|nr:GNAT family protein [Brachybacterium huguangmaarense]UYG17112.1 GNAT family N-acetyltransferase [Brachybacterium huguangmaarense]
MQHTIRRTCGAVTVRPLERADGAALRALSDEAMWRGNAEPLPTSDEGMADVLGALIAAPDVLAFAVEKDGRFVGRTTLYGIVPQLRAEIGSTIYARQVWATDVNPACKLLLLEHAFGELGVGRVALRCDHRNTRSHRAIARLGATFEGTLRRFRPAADGTVADVDYFSVIAEEWPAVREGLEARLAALAA